MLSRTKLDQLGDRLRASDAIAPVDRAAFEEYRVAHLAGLDEVRSRIGLELTFFSRLKTIESTIAKLRRQSIRLSQIADIGGGRIVLPGLAAQNDHVRQLTVGFEGCRVLDHRDVSQNGYRAVHILIPYAGRLRVEMQVRTILQDAWANASEWLAYEITMEIKYGGGPAPIQQRLHDLSQLVYRADRELADEPRRVSEARQLRSQASALSVRARPSEQQRLVAKAVRLEARVSAGRQMYENLLATLNTVSGTLDA